MWCRAPSPGDPRRARLRAAWRLCLPEDGAPRPRQDQGGLPASANSPCSSPAVDPIEAPMPVTPTAHYMMGGIPTNLPRKVVGAGALRPGRAGTRPLRPWAECALRIGAWRQPGSGGNSLLDLVVFGPRRRHPHDRLPARKPDPRAPCRMAEVDKSLARLARWINANPSKRRRKPWRFCAGRDASG